MLKVRFFVVYISILYVYVYNEMNEVILYKFIGDFFVGMI